MCVIGRRKRGCGVEVGLGERETYERNRIKLAIPFVFFQNDR